MIDETFEEIKLSGDLPSPSGVGMRILQLTRTEDYDTSEIGQAIMTDSSLTGQILRVANSAANAGVEPATTVTDAIMRLGSSTVRDLALAFSLVSDRSIGSCSAFDYNAYWSRSLARAVSAQELSSRARIGKPEEAYICGLLGEIGQLALASVFPDMYSEILDSGAANDPVHLTEQEAERFKITGSQVAACMLKDWGLPEGMVEAVEGFAANRLVGEREGRMTDLAGVLRFADLTAHACMLKGDEPGKQLQSIEVGLGKLASVLEVEEPELGVFFNTCVRAWSQWGESLDIDANKSLKFSAVQTMIEEGRNRTSASPKRSDGASSAAPASKSAQTSRSSEQSLSQVRILFVGEGSDVSKDVEKDPRFPNCVCRVTSLENALKDAVAFDPDIVFCGEREEGTGRDLCQTLRKSRIGNSVYFILSSSDGTENAIVRAFDVGIDDYVVRPTSNRLLLARLKGGMRLAKLQRQVEKDRRTMRKQVSELGIMTRKLRTAALTDPLTELPNRRYGMKRLESEWAATDRTGRPLSIISIDIDHFKSVNDTYGHDIGDVVLRAVAHLLRSSLRQSDEVCRIGGEEFLAICKNTSQYECALVAERIRRAVAKYRIQEKSFDGNVTISLGVAGRNSSTPDLNALLKAADRAVYEAKATGRNKACVAPDPARPSRSA